MYPHQIRLHGPWRWRTPDGGRGEARIEALGSAAGLPANWADVELHRAFHWIAAIQPHERIVLEVDGCVGFAQFRLNGVRLGVSQNPFARFRADVTRLLAPRNELSIALSAGPAKDREPIGGLGGLGVSGGARLSVESADVEPGFVRLFASWEDGVALARADIEIRLGTAEAADEKTLGFAIEIAGAPVVESRRSVGRDWTLVSQSARCGEAPAWKPAGAAGGPALVPMTVSVRADRGVVHAETFAAGFAETARSLAGDDERGEGPLEVAWPPPSGLLDATDRAGRHVIIMVPSLVLFEPDGPRRLDPTDQKSSDDWRAYLGRLAAAAWHPSIAAWRIDPAAPESSWEALQAWIESMGDRRPILAPRRH